MTKKNNTKRALILSTLSLLLCFSMLIGTTFAWFTDSASSKNNIIKTGKLDIELEYARTVDGALSEWKSVSGRSDIFDPNALWEPGRAEVVYLKVSNLGTLAFKYKLAVNIIHEDVGENADGEAIHLSELLVYKVLEMDSALNVFPDRKAAIEAAGTTRGIKDYTGPVNVLAPGEIDYVALVIYMPESIGNEANYRGTEIPTIELGINAIAAQAEYEKDGFGSDYDKGAYLSQNAYGLYIDQHTDFSVEDYNFDVWSDKQVDALIHVTDSSETNIYGNTNHNVYCGSNPAAPVISADEGSVVNIYGGSYTGRDAPIVTAATGARVNIYRGIFKAEAFTGSAAPTDAFVNFDEASDSEVKIYGGTFVNFDPRVSAYGNLVDDSCVVLTTHRDNGEIWYTVVPKENRDYLPVFSAEEIRKAIDDRVESIVIACDINLDKDTETLLRGKAGHTLVVDGLGAIITPDGTGTTPGSQDYGYIAFIPKPGDDAVISNMRFTGRGFVEVGHHKEGGGKFTISNLVIEDLIATLHITNDDNPISPAFTPYGTNYLIDCVMTGTTTEKVGYKAYDAAFVSGTKTFIQGGEYGSVYTSRHTQLTINGAEIDTLDCYVIKVKNGKGKLTIGADAKIGTLNIIPYLSYSPSIVIEEGAEIGVINYMGESYTLEEWLARE